MTVIMTGINQTALVLSVQYYCSLGSLGSIKTHTILGPPLMFLINFQLWARSRKIPGGGSFNIRGGVIKRGKRLVFIRGSQYFSMTH